MANGVGPVLTLSGKVNSSNALVVTGATGASTGGRGPIGNLQGVVDASNRLKVVFV